MKKTMFPMFALAFLVMSCDSMEGNLNVTEELTLKAKKTGLFQSGTREIKVPAAAYEAKLNPTSETNINLELKVSGKDQKIPFKIPKGTRLPEFEGKLDILSQDSGQPYDLVANVSTDQSSYNFDRNESCVIRYVATQRCITSPASRSCRVIAAHQKCEPRGPRHNNPGGSDAPVCRDVPQREECVVRPRTTNCHIEQVPVYGSQLVSYEKVITVRKVVVDVAASGRVVGQFNHSDSKSRDVAVNSTICR
jgi:hypothetical protein